MGRAEGEVLRVKDIRAAFLLKINGNFSGTEGRLF